MAKIFWGNSSNVPKKISTMFIGESSKPKLIKKIYIGDSNNQPKLCYTDSSNLIRIDYVTGDTITSDSSNPVYISKSATGVQLHFTISAEASDPTVTAAGCTFTKSSSGDSLTVTITSVQSSATKISIMVTQGSVVNYVIKAGSYMLVRRDVHDGSITVDDLQMYIANGNVYPLNDVGISNASVYCKTSSGFTTFPISNITADVTSIKMQFYTTLSPEYTYCGYIEPDPDTDTANTYGILSNWGQFSGSIDDADFQWKNDNEVCTLVFEADTVIPLSDNLYKFFFGDYAIWHLVPAIHWGVYTWSGGTSGSNRGALLYHVKNLIDSSTQEDWSYKVMSKIDSSYYYYYETPGNFDSGYTENNVDPYDKILVPFTQMVDEETHEFFGDCLSIYDDYVGPNDLQFSGQVYARVTSNYNSDRILRVTDVSGAGSDDEIIDPDQLTTNFSSPITISANLSSMVVEIYPKYYGSIDANQGVRIYSDDGYLYDPNTNPVTCTYINYTNYPYWKLPVNIFVPLISMFGITDYVADYNIVFARE